MVQFPFKIFFEPLDIENCTAGVTMINTLPTIQMINNYQILQNIQFIYL